MSAGPYANIVEEVRERCNIISLIGEYVVLKKAGRYFKGLCPFHQEKTPSFHVDPDKQLFHCFGCGTGGDIFTFVEKIEGLDFVGALKFLGKKFGINTEIEGKKSNPSNDIKQAILKINQLAAQYYHYILTNVSPDSTAANYLMKRGIAAETRDLFQLGFSPGNSSLRQLLQKKNIPLSLGEKAGLLIKGEKDYYDRFRQRIIFPIHDYLGQIIGFGGRIIGEGQPKYLNSPETLVYSKSKSLYGLKQAKDFIRQNGYVIIVEGYFDVISPVQHGIRNVVASLGTALTLDQAKLLKRYTEKVYIAYDSDTAGQAATLRGLDILAQAGLEVKVIILPKGEDPDSFCQKEGGPAFLKLIEKSYDLVAYKYEQITKNYRFDNFTEKNNALKEIIPFIYDLKSPLLQEEYLIKTSKLMNLNEDILRLEYYQYKRLKQLSSSKTDNSRRERNNNKQEIIGEVLLGQSLPKAVVEAEEIILKVLMENPGWRSFFLDNQLCVEDFVRPLSQKIFKDIIDGQFNHAEYLNQRANEGDDSSGLISSLFLRPINSEDIKEKLLLDLIRRLKEYNLRQRLKELEKELMEPDLQKNPQRLSEKLTELSNLKLKLSKDFSSFLST